MRTLVTGSTSGIEREAALALGRLGANVIVHGRDQAAGESVANDITEMGTTAQFVEADFTDVEAVHELAATVRDETDGLDLLINNVSGFFRRGRRTQLGLAEIPARPDLADFLFIEVGVTDIEHGSIR